MATPTFRSAGTWAFTATSVTNPTTLTPGAPAGVAVGDLLILIAESRSITATVATPTGWNLVSGFPERSATSSGGSFYVWTRIADGTASDTPSPVWSGLGTGTSGSSSGAGILAYQNATETLDGTVQLSDLSGQGATTVIPAFTTATNNSLVVGVAMKLLELSGQTSTVTPFTERADNETSSGVGHTIEVCDTVVATAGSSGTATVTWSNTTTGRALAVSLGLKATSGAGNASGSLPTLTLSSPAASATGDAAAAGGVPTLTLSTPAASATGAGGATGAVPTLTESSPAASATGTGAATGALPTLTLAAPQATAGVSVTGSGTLGTLTLTAAAASATGDGGALAALPTLTISAPSATATGDGAAVGSLPTLTLAAPDAAAGGDGISSGGLPTLILSAPLASADGGGGTPGLASGDFGTLLLNSPLATATASGAVIGGPVTPGSLAAIDEPELVHASDGHLNNTVRLGGIRIG